MAARNNPTTGWKAKANETAARVKNAAERKKAALKEEEELIKQLSEEHSLALKEIGPKAGEVCAYYAESIKGKLSKKRRNEVTHWFDECKHLKELDKNQSTVDVLRYILTGPDSLTGCIYIEFDPSGITLKTYHCTKELLSRCKPKERNTPESSMEFYRDRITDEKLRDHWFAYYIIPHKEFNQEKFAELLAIFIQETFNEEAREQIER